MREIGNAFVEARIAGAAKAFMPKGCTVKIKCSKKGKITVTLKSKARKYGRCEEGYKETQAHYEGWQEDVLDKSTDKNRK